MTTTAFENIEAFLFFIGYPRSGHSLVGSLLDAHPEAVIAHELGAFSYFEKNKKKEDVFAKIIEKSVQFTQEGRNWMGYNYAVPDQWQGKYEKIKIIGDKSGGRTTRRFIDFKEKDPVAFVRNIVQKELKIVHVIRNPFDNITTMCLRTHKRNGKPINRQLLDLKISHYFRMVEMNQQIRHENPTLVFDIHLESFIDQPRGFLKQLCQFIGLEANDKYLDDCASIVWAKANKTSAKIEHLWTPDIVKKTQQHIEKYDFLTAYKYL